nr:MAG TPA: hypothetical protein [Caudoviricetes sp.]
MIKSEYSCLISLSCLSAILQFKPERLSEIAVIAAYCQPTKKFTYS